MSKSASEIQNDLIISLLTNEPNADTQDGSLIRDINIDPQSVQFSYLYDEIDTVKLLSAWKKNAENISTEDLDNIGNNIDVYRKPATYATSIITFRAKQKPNQRIRIGNEDGTGGINVKSMELEDQTYYQFSTTKTVYLETEPQFNESTGFYEVSAPITAVISGSDSNVGVGTIIILETPISGIDSIYNYVAATGGEEVEGNVDYANDLSTALQGATKNTENGIKDILNELDGISEIKIFNPNSEEQSEIGTTYAYIKTNNESIYQDTFTYNITSNTYRLTKRPIKRIVSVKAFFNGELKTCTENIEFYLQQDTKSLYSFSSNSNDCIIFTSFPDNNSTITIDYIYVEKVNEAQDLILEQEDNILILGNIIVKTAQPIYVDIVLDMKLKYGYNTIENQNNIISGIQNYINQFKLGEDFSAVSLFSYLVQNFNYIESINYPFTVFKSRENNTKQDIIKAVYGQYITVDENSIKVNFG
ncbi:MAG: baseplate J/gp47 family protein [Staphylococcus sp.]|nr:baseplate J/gp47 family protein [Staphylococcus sp.]